jgi:hypothetical protein
MSTLSPFDESDRVSMIKTEDELEQRAVHKILVAAQQRFIR